MWNQEQVVLVTGVGNSIGRLRVLAFLRRGARAAAICRCEEGLKVRHSGARHPRERDQKQVGIATGLCTEYAST